jgi:hypothetical protein
MALLRIALLKIALEADIHIRAAMFWYTKASEILRILVPIRIYRYHIFLAVKFADPEALPTRGAGH